MNSRDVSNVVELLGALDIENVNKSILKSHHQYKVNPKSIGEASIVILLGSWSKACTDKRKVSFFLEKISSKIQKDLKENEFTVFKSLSSIRIGSLLINNQDNETLDFCIKSLLCPDTLPTIAIAFQSFLIPSEIPLIQYLPLLSSDIYNLIDQQSINENKFTELIDAIQNTLLQCNNQLLKAKALEGVHMNHERKRKREIPAKGPKITAHVESECINDGRKKQHVPQLRIFIAGDRSQVGKSSICMGLLGSLLTLGYSSQDLAYIKPATQCEKQQNVAEFCRLHNISCVPIGPVVYYKGFTREFLAGNTHSSQELLVQISESVDAIAQNKKIVIIDGVGYPAVGSICGTDNASVASVSGILGPNKKRLPVPVLIVGKKGVGDAIDSFNLNSAYFESKNIPILGAIFNRIPLDGYYSLENCKEQILRYFSIYKSSHQVFGLLPEMNYLGEGDEKSLNEKLQRFAKEFNQYIDVTKIISEVNDCTEKLLSGSYIGMKDQEVLLSQTVKKQKTSTIKPKLTREQIEKAAISAGAVAAGA